MATIEEDDDDLLTGLGVDEDIGQPIVQESAKQALRQYNLESAEENYRFIVQILGSIPWILAGYEHYIKLLLGKSSYLKKEMPTDEFYALTDYGETNEADRKIIVATCCYCKEGMDGSTGPNPCGDISLSEDVWANFDRLKQ